MVGCVAQSIDLVNMVCFRQTMWPPFDCKKMIFLYTYILGIPRKKPAFYYYKLLYQNLFIFIWSFDAKNGIIIGVLVSRMISTNRKIKKIYASYICNTNMSWCLLKEILCKRSNCSGQAFYPNFPLREQW